MGVHGLWELLAPVGRRVSVETLAGKRLAIDASIWIIQFMKAMRDEKGEMVRNAHILGFFRRICKLLYLRTKPVFIFDGGTPVLKRRTVIARRRQRDNAQAKIRKTAEKLLLNQLKQMRLKELAADLEKQRRDNDMKGKKPIVDAPSSEKETDKVNSNVDASYNQEALDAMLAASLAAEENDIITYNASTSGAGVKDNDALVDEEEDDEDEDEDEEMILPELHGNVDPAVLASLPPSMQLDLLVQMRERLMAENRQKYQKVKKAPSRFSELQIESYLKTVAFRREIDGVQKAAAGRGIGGMQTSRIASEANREYIFSSSFTGDKQAFMSIGQERSEASQSQAPPAKSSSNSVNEVLPNRKARVAAGPAAAEQEKKTFHEGVETYLDERGRLRVSRVRALGIRMTRDLQRNLDLMKEADGDNAVTSQEKTSNSIIIENPVDVPDMSFDKTHHRQINDENNDVNGTSIEISFEDTLHNENKNGDDDDKIFALLVAGDPVKDFSQTLDPDSDNEWEEGVVENKSLCEGGLAEEEDVEWEDEGFQNSELKSSYGARRTKGALEEEANIQEAIRRSLEDARRHELINGFEESNIISKDGDTKMVSENEETVFVYEREQEGPEIGPSAAIVSQKTVAKGVEEEHRFQEVLRINLEDHNENIMSKGGDEDMVSEDENGVFVNEVEQEGPWIEASDANVSKPNSIDGPELNYEGVKSAELVELNTRKDNSKPELEDGMLMAEKQPLNISSEGGFGLSSSSAPAEEMLWAASEDHACGALGLGQISAADSVTDVDGANKLAKEKAYDDFSMENEEVWTDPSFLSGENELETMQHNLEEEMLLLDREREDLGSEQRKLERNSESVSNEMFAECQELLQMFGLPYIIAPMEAEAQCAFMELSNLVDGVVTDDSDAFLFGARSVYKNIFDDRKYVETYFMKDIENELGLDREKLIHMALLLGSDYTEGISGIGIVNAIEVVNAFPGKDDLREFREWIESPDPMILGKLDVDLGSSSRRKGPKGGENVRSGSSGVEDENAESAKQIFMEKHRNVSKNWHISSSFPSDAVILAYASPQVDKSTEALTWGKPDQFVLRRLCWEKFGWGASKADELLLPVLKEYNKHETQLRLEAFYTFNERFAKIRSKRIKKAVKNITKNKPSDLMDETAPQQPLGGKKRKAKSAGDDEANQSDGTNDTLENATVKQQLKIGHPKERTPQKDLLESVARKESPARGKRVNQRGRGRGQTSARGRNKKNSSWEDAVISGSETDEEIQFGESGESSLVRRSERVRKPVNYNISNVPEDTDKESDEEYHLKETPMAGDPLVAQAVSNFNGGRNDSAEGTQGTTREKDKSTIPDLANDNQTDEQIFKEGCLSKDYLQFGGGFCADEEDEGSNDKEGIPGEFDGLNFCDSPVGKENREHSSSVSIPPKMSGEKRDLAEMNVVDGDYSLPDETENYDAGSRFANSLRSMPNLRRKKKKN